MSENFSVLPGQTVFAPAHGLALVIGVVLEPGPGGVSGEVLEVRLPGGALLKLKKDEAAAKIRPLVTAEQAAGLLRTLRSEQILPDNRTPQEREQEQLEVISAGKAEEMAWALRELHGLGGRRTSKENTHLELLEEMVLGELAAVLGASFNELRAEMRHHHLDSGQAVPARPVVAAGAEAGSAEKAREAIAPKLSCYRHAAKEAVDTCQDCHRPICEVCTTAVANLFMCPACAAHRRKRRRIWLAVGGGLALAAAWVLAIVVLTRDGKPVAVVEPPRHSLAIEKLIHKLDQDPCDRVKMLKLSEELFAADGYREVLDRSEAFFQKCEPFPRLRWLTYAAHKELGEFPEAVAEAGKLIEQYPYDWDFRWWRGEAYERDGKLKEAIADYRQSLVLQPRLDTIPFRLAGALSQVGLPCEGILPIANYLYQHSEDSEDPDVRERLDRLASLPQCDAYAGSGTASFDFPTEDTAPTFGAKLNGKAPGRFRPDPDQLFVLVSGSLAKKIGVAPGSGTPIVVWVDEKGTNGTLVTLESFEAGGARAERVEAVVVDSLPDDVDGLMGQSFLSRFAWSDDQEAGKLLLDPWGTAEDEGQVEADDGRAGEPPAEEEPELEAPVLPPNNLPTPL